MNILSKNRLSKKRYCQNIIFSQMFLLKNELFPIFPTFVIAYEQLQENFTQIDPVFTKTSWIISFYTIPMF